MGDEIKFDPGVGEEYTWNVINETSDKVTLLLNYNFDSIYWNTVELYNEANKDGTLCPTNVCTDEGPLNILNYLSLEDFEAGTGNIEYIENYSYINESYGSYKSIEIKNGEITITDDNNNKNILPRKTKMRILTFEELYKIVLMANPNFSYEISDVKFDDNFEEILDNYNSDIESDAKQRIHNWQDLRAYYFEKNLYTTNLTRTEKLIINSHLLLYSENRILGVPNIEIPTWLFSNVDGSFGLLNTMNNYYFTMVESSPSVIFEELCDYNQNGFVCKNIKVGIRPVIEVSKDKLK